MQCDLLRMKYVHIILGRLQLFDERVQHDGYENTYTLTHNGHKKILCPMKEMPPLQQPKEKLASLEPEDPPNTLIKKHFEVASKDKEIARDKSRMQEVIEPVLDQPVGKLKKVVKLKKNDA